MPKKKEAAVGEPQILETVNREEFEEPEVEEEEIEEPEEEQELEEETPEEVEEQPEEPEVVEIVHNGQVHKVTREKLVELAQKGFDYDYKVGPHGKLVQLVDEDEELQKLINDHVRQKYEGKEPPKPQQEEDIEFVPLDDSRTPEEWLKENIKRARKAWEGEARPAAPPQNALPPTGVILQMRDPEHFQDVMKVFHEELWKQPYARVQSIDKDLGELIKFYDEVRAGVTKEAPAKPTTTNNPPFRMPSGGHEQRSDKPKPNVWDLPNDKFQEIISKAKGY